MGRIFALLPPQPKYSTISTCRLVMQSGLYTFALWLKVRNDRVPRHPDSPLQTYIHFKWKNWPTLTFVKWHWSTVSRTQGCTLGFGLLTNTSRNEKWFKARCTWFTCRITNRSRNSFQVPNLLPSYQKRTYPHSMKLPTRSFKKVVKVFWHLTKVQYLCNINMR